MKNSHNNINLESPENAILSLEKAYVNKDWDSVLKCKDFNLEAKYLIAEQLPGMENNKAIIDEMAQSLQLSLQHNIQENGFPSFTNISSRNFKISSINDTLVMVRVDYKYVNGGESSQTLNVGKTNEGWKVLSLLD